MINKLGDPTGNGKILVTQTYHGEKTALPDTQCAIDIRMYANEYYHSAVNGVVEKIASDYLSIVPDGCRFRVLYVHTNRPKVVVGQRVSVGQILGQIPPITSPHLHFGLKWLDMHKPAPRVMDYIDRSIPITTDFNKYPAIASEWFTNGQFDWSKHQDLDFITNQPVPIVVPPVVIPPIVTPEPEPTHEPPTPPITPKEPITPPVTPPTEIDTPEEGTKPKTLLEIIVQFFTDLILKLIGRKSD